MSFYNDRTKDTEVRYISEVSAVLFKQENVCCAVALKGTTMGIGKWTGFTKNDLYQKDFNHS